MSILPFSFQEITGETSFRASQETILKLAYKNTEEKKFQEAVVFFERVEHSLHHEGCKEKVRENIKTLLDLLKEKKNPPEQKPEPPKPNPVQSPAMQIRVENISLSGVEMTGSEKALEMFSKIFSGEKQHQIEEAIEETAHEEIQKIEEKLFKEIREQELRKPEETEPEPLPVKVKEETLSAVKEEMLQNPEEAQENPFIRNHDEPIKVEQVAPQKKLEKVKPTDLTYNFTNVFYSKFYLKYSDLFNEAARLVREKKLDEAIDYYKVLLDQKLPETLKLMIQQNVEDLKLAIINTFKYSDTIVRMDESGNLIRVDDNSIRVLETGGNRNDVYFKEES